MRINGNNGERYSTPGESLQEIKRDIEQSYQVPDKMAETTKAPSLFDANHPANLVNAQSPIDFAALGEHMAASPAAYTKGVVKIGERLTHVREYEADAA